VTMAVAGSGTNYYPVVGVSPTTIISSATWNENRHGGLMLWWPLTENSFQPLKPVSAQGLSADDVWMRPGDRKWHGSRGWTLQMGGGGTVVLDRIGLPDNYSFALAARPVEAFTPNPGYGSDPAVRVGAAELYFSESLLTLKVADDAGPVTLTQPISGTDFTLVCVNVGTTSARLLQGNASGWVADSSVACRPGAGWTGARLSVGACAVQMQDFMVWERHKTPEMLNTIRAPRFLPIGSGSPQSYVGGVTGGCWGLELLPSGFVVPSQADTHPALYPSGAVRRYEGTGRYVGNPTYKQVGLGGAQTMVDEYRLGTVGPTVPGAGEVVSIGTWGEPGINVSWSGTAGTLYKVSPPYGSSGGDTTLTIISTGTDDTLSDWPPALARYNPAYDRIYLRGLSGQTYEVSLDDVGNGPQLVTAVPSIARPAGDSAFTDLSVREVAGNFETRIRESAYEITVNSSGTVVSENTGGAWLLTEDNLYILDEEFARLLLENEFSTLPAYLYLNSRVKSWATNAFTRWVNPVDYGLGLGIAARDTAGVFEFENTDALPAGFYRLSVDCGNIGSVDSQFAGFDVIATIDTGLEPIEFPVTLLPLGRGSDPRGWTQVEFTLPYDVDGPWRLRLEWTNDRDVPSRGEFRRLAIYQYTMRRIASELYRIRAHPFTITPVDVAAPPVQPGAYVASYNSYGTVVSYAHEQNLYSSTQGRDAFNNPRSPLADTLTGSTLQRRDSLDVLSPWLLPDPAPPVPPTSGTLIVTPSAPYYNIGDSITIQNTGATGVAPLRRVWHLWSAGTRTTYDDTIVATVDRGGTLDLNLDVVDPYGQAARTTSFLIANPSPVISLATASVTSAPVPYSTNLTAVVSEDDPFTVTWWKTAPTAVQIGSGFTLNDYTVEETQQVRVYAIDNKGGTSFADIPLTGGVNAAPRVTLSQMVPSKLKAFSSLTSVGTQTLSLTALAFDPENRGLTTQWNFSWDSALGGPGAVQPLDFFGGGTLCSIERQIIPLTDNTPGVRGFSFSVTDGDGNTTTVTGEVPFVKNQKPIVTELAASNTEVQAGELVQYSAVAYDPDGDVIDYNWDFPSINLKLKGPNVSIDTTGLAGRSLGGSLRVSDEYGGERIIDVSNGFPNVIVYDSGLAPLTLDPAGGVTAQGVTVVISSSDLPNDPAIEIRYTTDGYPPVTINDGLPYRWPIALPYEAGKIIPINARAFKAGVAPSPLASATFIFQ